MRDEYIIEPSKMERTRYFVEDTSEEEAIRIYLDGLDGGPDAVLCRHSPGAREERHFHHGAQFQLTLDGLVEYPTVRVEPPGVLYTDHNTAYGPFTMLEGHQMLVLHPRPAGQMWVTEPGAAEARNRQGRQLVGHAKDAPWEVIAGRKMRRKLLLSPDSGPWAEILECEPGATLGMAHTTYGRFEFIINGSASIDNGPQLERETLRFVRGEPEFSPLVAGPDGATIAVCCFDEDASKGEKGGLSIADRMAQFQEVDRAKLQLLRHNR